ncbi:hypothetical protein [Absidia glauca]|uniref:Uncharacterized protein n=1 Tax=Absidia glauca TaxID=4829 RepID=A0A168LQ63_ABSGL|nr:hypothetical protein [Absidia glauca]
MQTRPSIKKEVIEDNLLDLSSPLPPVAAVDPALTVLPAVSVSPSAPVLCYSFSPRPLDDSDDDDEESDNLCADTHFGNGMICDTFFQSMTGVPVLVEIQNAITNAWIRDKLFQYCIQVIKRAKDTPFVFVFPIKPIPKDVLNIFDETKTFWFAHELSCPCRMVHKDNKLQFGA